jgi:asparagine synthetase B (glutamine-hydrolysing)
MRRVIMHRNAGGVAPTWYHAGPDGLRFASNLNDLVEATGEAARLAPGVMASYVHCGQLPWGATLFDGIASLLPGETLTWDPSGLSRFARCRSLVVDATSGRDGVLARVLTDYAAYRPAAVTLLSGGAGSRRLQSMWNGMMAGPGLPSSYSLAVDNSHSWSNTDDALNAAHDLGTCHTLVPAEAFPDALCSAVAATGEPPPDELTPYFGQLGATLAQDGISAVLAGDGNDALLSPARGGLLRRLGLLAPAAADSRAVLDRAALRSVLLQSAGVDLLCPYLDSRVLRLAIAPPVAQPSWLPPASWLAPGGCLRPFVERLDDYPNIDRSALAPGALFRLVCCDIWRKYFAAGFVSPRQDSPSSPAIPIRAA